MKNVFVCIVCLSCVCAHATTEVVDGIAWTYTVNDGKASVGGGSSSSATAVPKATAGAITIPSSLGGYPVTSIGQSAFRGCSGLTNVTIPDSVTSIFGWAFEGCCGLTSVTIPNSVINIWQGAFEDCRGLASVTISNGVKLIGAGAFRNCSGLKSVKIPGSVKVIGEFAFMNCSGLTSVSIPNSTSIIDGAFSGCNGLANKDGFVIIRGVLHCCANIEAASVTIPFGVTSIGGVAFDGCIGLKSVSIPGSVTNIGDWAFSGCGLLTSISIPDGVINIGNGAFCDCSGLKSVMIPDSVMSIGDEAFYGCRQLRSVSLPKSLKDQIDSYNYVFALCPADMIVTYRDATRDIVITFNANGGIGGKTVTLKYGSKLTAPTVTRTGYTFAGWSPAVPATVPANNATYTAQWKKNQDPVPMPEPEEVHGLYEDVEGVAPLTAASEYNGYLYDDKGAVKGTIQVKVGKPNAKTGLATIKATVVIGTKKVTLKAADKGKAVLSSDGPTELELVGGEACEVVFGSEGLSGYYGTYEIDGARNLFASKDKSELAAVNGILAKWQGAFMVIWDGGTLSVSIAAKGKVKVSGTLANGTKVTANTVLLVGEEWSCISVAAQKANLAFVLWLSHDGKTIEAEGLGDDVHVGLPGTLTSGATFQIDAAEFAAVFGQTMLPYFPNGVAVKQSGTKWTLPKAGKVVYKNGAVDASKLGENPCGLKLTYKAKDGTFKGSFKVYTEVKGKPKATTVNVTGFMLNGVGYGTATVKGKNGVPVTIE